jgi:hypothetical protein
LGLRIAAGNVPNFVDLQTGAWGGTIQDPLNGGQTPTMSNFATLADVLAGCVTLIRSDACSSLYYAATSPRGEYPRDTLAAAENIARYPESFTNARGVLYHSAKIDPGVRYPPYAKHTFERKAQSMIAP